MKHLLLVIFLGALLCFLSLCRSQQAKDTKPDNQKTNETRTERSKNQTGVKADDQTCNYIDVHVHLRGVTKSGLLGNARERNDIDGSKPVREKTNRGNSAPEQFLKEQSDNLEIAAKNMIAKMDELQVKQALVVVVPSPASNEMEEKIMRQITMKHPERLKLLAGGAILSPFLQKIKPEKVTEEDRAKFREIATQLLKDGAVGFGEMISYHLSMADHHSFQYAPPDHPLFFVLADIAAEHNVPIDIHMEAIVKQRPMPDNLRRASKNNPDTLEPTIPAFEKLLKHNPKAKIVWQHIGWDNTGDMTPELIGRLLAQYPNLYIALRVEKRNKQVGNGPAMPNRLVDEQNKLNPEWVKVFEKNRDRITIGSDEFFFPVVRERPNQSFVETWDLLKQLSSAVAKKIGGENAKRIYGLK